MSDSKIGWIDKAQVFSALQKLRERTQHRTGSTQPMHTPPPQQDTYSLLQVTGEHTTVPEETPPQSLLDDNTTASSTPTTPSRLGENNPFNQGSSAPASTGFGPARRVHNTQRLTPTSDTNDDQPPKNPVPPASLASSTSDIAKEEADRMKDALEVLHGAKMTPPTQVRSTVSPTSAAGWKTSTTNEDDSSTTHAKLAIPVRDIAAKTPTPRFSSTFGGAMRSASSAPQPAFQDNDFAEKEREPTPPAPSTPQLTPPNQRFPFTQPTTTHPTQTQQDHVLQASIQPASIEPAPTQPSIAPLAGSPIEQLVQPPATTKPTQPSTQVQSSTTTPSTESFQSEPMIYSQVLRTIKMRAAPSPRDYDTVMNWIEGVNKWVKSINVDATDFFVGDDAGLPLLNTGVEPQIVAVAIALRKSLHDVHELHDKQSTQYTAFRHDNDRYINLVWANSKYGVITLGLISANVSPDVQLESLQEKLHEALNTLPFY